jgi:hypothetical protein
MRNGDYSNLPPSAHEYLNWIKHDLGLAIILKGHLFIDHLLSLAISKRLGEQEVSKGMLELGFRDKVERAAELGIIRPEDQQVYITLKDIRNEFAHEPRRYFSSQDAEILYEALPEDVKQQLIKDDRKPDEACEMDSDFCADCLALLMDRLTQTLR